MKRFWDAVLLDASDRASDPFVFIGDLNTGLRRIDERGGTFHCADHFARMSALGWTDAWRHCNGSAVEPTWISTARNGFRLDIWTIRTKVFHQCRKTLQNRLAILSLPSPGILSRYGRVLHAQELERRGMKPTAAVSSLLGFPSAGAMLRSKRRLRKALMTRGREALVFASLLK